MALVEFISMDIFKSRQLLLIYQYNYYDLSLVGLVLLLFSLSLFFLMMFVKQLDI